MLESRMALDERLRSKFGGLTQSVVHPLLDSVGPTKDPYAFHDEGVKELKVSPKELPKDRKSGRSKTIAQLTGVAKPSQRKSNAKITKNVNVSSIAKLYPALADKLGQQPQPKQLGLLKPQPARAEGDKPAETVNKLENKIAQSRIRDKQKKAQGADAKLGASLSTATATIPAVQGVFPSVPAAIVTPPLRLPASNSLPGSPVVAPPMISHPQLPSSFAYAHLGAYPSPIAIDPTLAFPAGYFPVQASSQSTPVKESKPSKAAKHNQACKSSKSSVKPEVKTALSKPEPVQPFRQITPPSSPVTITQMRIRPRQEARHKTKHVDERLSSVYSRKVHQCLCRKRRRSPDLLPSGIYSSEDSDSDDDIQVPWQREWFRPPVLPNYCIPDGDGEHFVCRSQSLVLTRASLRHELMQLHHAQQQRLTTRSHLPDADLILLAAAAKDAAATANVLSVLRESKSWYSQRRKVKSKKKKVPTATLR